MARLANYLPTLQGVAKAWFNLNGTGTIAERKSYNITSYVDNGTGDYTANYANNMADVNSAILATSEIDVGTDTDFGCIDFDNPPTVSAHRLSSVSDAGVQRDSRYIASSVMGDLA